ncbi:MAG: peptidase domain-containing ABC transporter [Lachnospiraceae bacterium]|nr:peptidase domain-containing ABC transporter [Lachnospiraceae bacterium]MDE7204715.1 peptidase domain-containing ABC transporter [Lachnospiraceae bacterium]
MYRRKKMPFIAQLGRMDCGIACLTMIFNYYCCNVDIVDVGSDFFIGRDGISLAQMKKIAGKYGFNFAAYKYMYDQKNLIEKLPAILCNDSHYIVVEKIKKNGKFVVLDPAKGKYILEFSELQNNYKDILVYITPTTNRKKVKRGGIKLKLKIQDLSVAMVLMLSAQIITLCVPMIVQNVIDSLSKDIQPNAFKMMCVIFAVIFSYLGISWLRQVVLLKVNMELYNRMTSNMLFKLFRMDVSFFEWHTAGEIGNRFNNTNQLNDIITNGLTNIIIQGITSLVCMVVMFYMSVKLTVFVFAIAAIQIVIMIFLNNKNLLKTREYIYSQSKMQGDLIDTLGNIVEIKCMGMDNAVETNLQNNYQWLIAKFKEKTRVGNMMNCFTSMVNLGFPLAIYIFGSFDVYEGNMSVGTLIAFVTLVGYFTSPFNTIIMLLPSINGVREVLLRYKELMNFRERNHDGNAIDGEFNNIKMKEVFYRYNGGHDYALNNVSLDVQRGKRIAIVGSSGSGKSTLVKTLLGAVDIDQGNIYINNYEITEISRGQIYKWFAIVTQNPMCLNASIRKNVDITGAFSDDEIWNALEIAELKDEIKNMPLGLDTLVGEGGQNVSGGQKQRLAIARALIGNTEVLILDEATSNLDQMTEKKIYDNLKAINKTQIIVSHRLASIHNVDRIYVLNKGKIIESGTHSDLLKNKGWYYNSIN